MKQRITTVILGMAFTVIVGMTATQAQPPGPVNWGTLQLQNPATPTLPPASVFVTVVVPADAEVFFDGAPTKQRGVERLYQTPLLPYGKTFTYQVTARWNESGTTIESTREIEVGAGAGVRVDFPVATQGAYPTVRTRRWLRR
jgi:uncharacterized protein (TIGR03000 family)